MQYSCNPHTNGQAVAGGQAAVAAGNSVTRRQPISWDHDMEE